jgi:hypothetical protein
MNWEQINREYGTRHRIDGPHGWIQWKGTDVCMDIHCACGHHGHIDAEFVYMVRCPVCKVSYYVSPYVHLDQVEVDPDDGFVKEANL